MLFLIVEEENVKLVFVKFWLIVEVIGMDVNNKLDKECVDFVIDKIKVFFEEVGILKFLKDVGVDNFNFELFVENFMKDVCVGVNFVFFDKDKIIELFMKIF